MTGFVQRPSLASWRKAHGFGLLNIVSPAGEHFLVETQPDRKGFDAWAQMSETQLRQHLVQRGFSNADIEASIDLSREWATTITNAQFFPRSPES